MTPLVKVIIAILVQNRMGRIKIELKISSFCCCCSEIHTKPI